MRETLARMNKWKALPEHIKVMMMWSKWISWDALVTGKIATTNTYSGFIDWLNDYIRIEYSISLDTAPDVDASNYLKIYFQVEEIFYRDQIAEMEPYKDYKFRKMRKKGEGFYYKIVKNEKGEKDGV
jgi:hypothetical protein